MLLVLKAHNFDGGVILSEEVIIVHISMYVYNVSDNTNICHIMYQLCKFWNTIYCKKPKKK